jgi:hypothetical protein
MNKHPFEEFRSLAWIMIFSAALMVWLMVKVFS